MYFTAILSKGIKSGYLLWIFISRIILCAFPTQLETVVKASKLNKLRTSYKNELLLAILLMLLLAVNYSA